MLITFSKAVTDKESDTKYKAGQTVNVDYELAHTMILSGKAYKGEFVEKSLRKA